eukprot:3935851-Rhodomonas_salina.1
MILLVNSAARPRLHPTTFKPSAFAAATSALCSVPVREAPLQGLGSRALEGLGSRVSELGSRVSELGFGVEGLGSGKGPLVSRVSDFTAATSTLCVVPVRDALGSGV